MLYRSVFTILGCAVTAVIGGLIAAAAFVITESDATTRVLAAQVAPTPTPGVVSPNVSAPNDLLPPQWFAPTQQRRAPFARRWNITGTVVTNDGSTLTVQRAPQTLAPDANTKLVVVGKPNAQLADIQVGDKLTAFGARGNAQSPRFILAAPATYTRENVRLGRVKQTDANTWSLQTPRGAITLRTDAQTQIFNLALEPLTLAALQDRIVLVIGQPEGEALHVQVILTRAAQ